MSFVFQYSETKHATKNSTTDIAITLKVLIDEPKRKYIAISFKTCDATPLRDTLYEKKTAACINI